MYQLEVDLIKKDIFTELSHDLSKIYYRQEKVLFVT